MYFIDPADEEFKEIMRKCGDEYRETCSVFDNCKTKYACIVGADESTRKRMEGTLHKGHEDHIAGRGINSVNHYNLVHKFVRGQRMCKT